MHEGNRSVVDQLDDDHRDDREHRAGERLVPDGRVGRRLADDRDGER
jgi:hypothetical protein